MTFASCQITGVFIIAVTATASPGRLRWVPAGINILYHDFTSFMTERPWSLGFPLWKCRPIMQVVSIIHVHSTVSPQKDAVFVLLWPV